MIPRSTTFAAMAVLLSLAAHFFGLGFTWPVQPLPSVEEASSENVELGNAFEDLAESISEPVRPEPATVPEPPVEAAPVPEPADDPTSRALVASANPQAVSNPDTGTAQTVQPETTGPSTPETGDPSEPTVVAPAVAEERASLEARLAPPPGTDAENSIPQGQPSRRGESEAPPQNPAANSPAAMPTAAVPVPPSTVAPVPPSANVVALEPSEIGPEPSPATVEAESEPSQDLADRPGTGASEQLATTSLRPQLRPERPSSGSEGLPGGSPEATETRLAATELIESPLTAYMRDGTDAFGQQGGRARSGGQGFGNLRGPGNSDVTNYAGQVLVHLNRTASVAVAGRGWARVFFQINPDGTLASVDIVDGSGSQEIYHAARQQVRKAVPFPRPPGGKSKRLNFVYRIQ